MKDIELPPPLGYMNAGHVHELQQGRLHYGYVYPKGGTGAEEAVFTADQLRAAVEADRAQRVPDWETRAEIAEQQVVCLSEELDHFRDLYTKLLASTPAPAQQEPATPIDAHRAAYFMRRFLHEEKMLGPNEQAALHFTIAALEAMESAAQHQEPPQREPSPIKAEHKTVTPSGTVVTRLELTDKAKESLRANITHIPGIARHQEPSQQERKPMTDEIVRLAGVVLNEMPHPMTNWQSAAKKVCEAVAAIKEQT